MIGHLEKQAAKEAVHKASRIWGVALVVVLLTVVLFIAIRPNFFVTIGGVKYSVERVEK